MLRRHDGRARRDTSALSTVDQSNAVSSLREEEKVGLSDMQRDLGDERDLELRDLDADDDLERQTDVRDVDYDYIFGNSVNDDDDLVIIIISIIIVIIIIIGIITVSFVGLSASAPIT